MKNYQQKDAEELEIWKETLIQKLRGDKLSAYDKKVLILMIERQNQTDKDIIQPKLTRSQILLLKVMKERTEKRENK